jgi:hypothetical protein
MTLMTLNWINPHTRARVERISNGSYISVMGWTSAALIPPFKSRRISPESAPPAAPGGGINSSVWG